MTIIDDRSAPLRDLALMSPAERFATRDDWRALVDEMPADEREALLYRWEWWRRPAQTVPRQMGHLFRSWLVKAGRGYGKTRTGAETVRQQIKTCGRIALVAPTAADCRDVMIEGESGIMSVFPPGERPQYEPSKRRVIFHNGAMGTAYSAEEPDRLRGPQHEWAWGDEPACLPAATLVLTDDGWTRIDSVSAGDLAWTRQGWRPVVWAGMTRRDAELVVVELGDGRRLVCTPDHLLATDSGWSAAADSLGAIVSAWSYPSSMVRPPGLTGMTPAGTGRNEAGTPTATAISSTAPCGSPSTAQQQTTSTTLTRTRPTTVSTTSKRSPTQTTHDFTASLSGSPSNKRQSKRLSVPANYGRPVNQPTTSATNAGPPTSPPGCATGSAPRRAAPATVVRVLPLPEQQDTYDLTIDDVHEFVADGLIVHNSWKYGDAAMSNLRLGLRLGKHPWVLLTGTPKPTAWLRALSDEPTTVVTNGNTYENVANLAPGFITDILGRFEGTRLGRQEIHAEWLDDVEGALWTMKMIDDGRIGGWEANRPYHAINQWLVGHGGTPISGDRRVWRIIVAVDPPGETAECGIAVGAAPVGAIAGRDHAVFLDDMSISGRPEIWGAQVVNAARRWAQSGHPCKVYVESNQGGDMVRSTVHGVDPNVTVEKISARISKTARADPVSALYPRWVHHAGFFPAVESQMTTWVAGEGQSPDRMDALVHLFRTALSTFEVPASRVESPARSNRRVPTP